MKNNPESPTHFGDEPEFHIPGSGDVSKAEEEKKREYVADKMEGGCSVGFCYLIIMNGALTFSQLGLATTIALL
jgi:hypothetical protein